MHEVGSWRGHLVEVCCRVTEGGEQFLCGQFGLFCLSLGIFYFYCTTMTHINTLYFTHRLCFTRMACLFCLNVCLRGLMDALRTFLHRFCNSFRCVSGFDPISWRHHHEYIVFVHLINIRVYKNRNDSKFCLIYYCNILCRLLCILLIILRLGF